MSEKTATLCGENSYRSLATFLLATAGTCQHRQLRALLQSRSNPSIFYRMAGLHRRFIHGHHGQSVLSRRCWCTFVSGCYRVDGSRYCTAVLRRPENTMSCGSWKNKFYCIESIIVLDLNRVRVHPRRFSTPSFALCKNDYREKNSCQMRKSTSLLWIYT